MKIIPGLLEVKEIGVDNEGDPTEVSNPHWKATALLVAGWPLVTFAFKPVSDYAKRCEARAT